MAAAGRSPTRTPASLPIMTVRLPMTNGAWRVGGVEPGMLQVWVSPDHRRRLARR